MEVDERFGKLFQNEDFAIDQQSEEFKRSYASGLGRGAQADSEEEKDDDAMLQEDFDLLDEDNAKAVSEEAASEAASEESSEEAEPYVGRSGKKAREEQERIKPKVRFFGVKDSKVTIPTSRKEMKKEVEKRKERRTLSLGQRAKELEKKQRKANRS